MSVHDFETWLNETQHNIDPKGYFPSKWQDRRVTRNVDGKTGRVGKPIGDPNKGASGYEIIYDDGKTEILSISAIKKQFELYVEN